eukprot:m.172169 g.172169  ORF g.172169 m.172169 type:complete len:540 (+) comp31672_c2_seq1:280-1899(+)
MDVDHFALSTDAVATIASAKDETSYMLCCDCGTTIPVNPTAMCINCIRSKVDISEGIPKQVVIYYCRGCLRYLTPPATWSSAELESRELLTLCLKKLKGLDKVKMIDAGFLWTEPHSRRVKVKIAIQKEVMNGAILQQDFVVEYLVHHQFCEDCHRQEAKDTWNAVVQLRQKVKHKKTFFYLEQLIIKHRAYRDCINIKSRPDGVDFFFANKSKAKKMVDFFNSCSPIRSKTSERLISADIHTSSYNYKHTFSIELVPVCKNDVVCMHPALARKYGHMSPLAICTHVGSAVRFIDPATLNVAEMTAEKYWAKPFNSVCDHKQLVEYIVLEAELVYEEGKLVQKGKYTLCELTLARASDLGVNDEQCVVRSHLGNVIGDGDMVWAFDLNTCNLNDEYANKLDLAKFQQAIVVKKSYTDKRRRRKRMWKLKEVVEQDGEGFTQKELDSHATDFEGFMRDLEEDKELRSTINIYKDEKGMAAESEIDDEELRVDLDEMLDEFDQMDLAPAAVEDGDINHHGKTIAPRMSKAEPTKRARMDVD